MHLAAKRDVHRHDDLLDRRVAVDPRHARIPRDVQQLVPRVVGGRDALDDLGVCRIRRGGRAAVLVQDPLDRRAIDVLERVQLAAPGLPGIDRRRVGDEDFLEPHAKPVVPVVLLVRLLQECLDRFRISARLRLVLERLDSELELRHLVLPRLDRQAKEIVRVGQRAELRERDRFAGSGLLLQVVADRIVPAATFDRLLRRRRHRLARAEEVGRVTGEQPLDAGTEARERGRRDRSAFGSTCHSSRPRPELRAVRSSRAFRSRSVRSGRSRRASRRPERPCRSDPPCPSRRA
jgi:hypothetical protein